MTDKWVLVVNKGLERCLRFDSWGHKRYPIPFILMYPDALRSTFRRKSRNSPGKMTIYPPQSRHIPILKDQDGDLQIKIDQFHLSCYSHKSKSNRYATAQPTSSIISQGILHFNSLNPISEDRSERSSTSRESHMILIVVHEHHWRTRTSYFTSILYPLLERYISPCRSRWWFLHHHHSSYLEWSELLSIRIPNLH